MKKRKRILNDEWDVDVELGMIAGRLIELATMRLTKKLEKLLGHPVDDKIKAVIEEAIRVGRKAQKISDLQTTDAGIMRRMEKRQQRHRAKKATTRRVVSKAERDARIVTAYANDKSAEEIAAEEGLSASQVRRIISRSFGG